MLRTILMILFTTTALAGCSGQDDSDPADQTHVWQSQTDALRQAEQLRNRTNAETQRQQEQYDQLDQESRGQ